MSLHVIEELNNQTSAVIGSDGKIHTASYVWDTGSLTWVRATASGGGGGAGDASAANQAAQIDLETTIRDDTAINKGYLNTLASTVVSSAITTTPEGTGAAYWPGYKGSPDTGRAGINIDPGGALVTRGAVTTDEGTFRANFANTSLAVSIGSVSVSGTSVTGVGFTDTYDVSLSDYFKLDADGESSWVQVEGVVSDTLLILQEAYVGGTSGAASRALVRPVTGSGGAISVASGQLTMTTGTTNAAITRITRNVDVAPMVFRSRVSFSQRIANQTFRVGLTESFTTSDRWFARFKLDGTVNTTAVCESGRNPTITPSAAETESTTVILPGGATTAVLNDYRVEMLTEKVNFFINNILVATHVRSIPAQHDALEASVTCINGTGAASSTTVVVDYVTGKNHNKLEIGVMSDTEQIIAVSPPMASYVYEPTAGVITINTDLMIIDCLQLRSLYIHCTSMGTTGVVTPAWSNDNVNWITATLLTEAGAAATTFNAAALRAVNVRARYFRLRLTTATTAGTTTIYVNGSQTDASPVITTQAVSLATNTPTLAAGTNRAAFIAGAGIWYDDSAVVLAGAATFTGTSRDLTVTATATAMANAAAYNKEVRVSAESDQSGTLWVEYSRDNTNWRRMKSSVTAAITGGGQMAEVVFRPSWRYMRVGFTNGATLQTRFTINSLLVAN
jgi:hypothetical protein